MIVGIDLGTTNSLISIFTEGKLTIIPNSLGENLTPSVISVGENNQVFSGRIAKERSVTQALATASSFKRTIGTKKQYQLGPLIFSSAELSAILLKSLVQDAELHLKQKVTGAIISVPAYFNDTQRKDTVYAARLAGLEVKRLVNEPTAAAIAYGILDKGDSMDLVFDLGGGTFDVSIIEKYDDILEIRASTGNNQLGGNDFTDVILRKFLSDIKNRYEMSLQELSPNERELLKYKAERAKLHLSSHETFFESILIGEKLVDLSVTQNEFEELSQTLIQKLASPLQRALRDSKLASHEINQVILVGGSTRMPFIKKLIVKLFGKLPFCHINPDEAVCMGAGYLSEMIKQNGHFQDRVVTDVTPYTLGIAVENSHAEDPASQLIFSPILDRNTVVPCSKEKTYFPVAPNQNNIALQIYQGESLRLSDNVLIGTLKIPVTKRPATEEQFSVRFTYDSSGLLEVIAKSFATGKSYRDVFKQTDYQGLDEDIDQVFKKLETLKVHPRDLAENQYVLETLHRIYAESVGELRNDLVFLINEFEKALASQDPNQVNECRNKVKELMKSFSPVE